MGCSIGNGEVEDDISTLPLMALESDIEIVP